MALTHLPTARSAWGFAPVLRRVAALRARRRTNLQSADAAEDARHRRAFVQDMLGRNPQAFACEEDVQNMMHMYPGRF